MGNARRKTFRVARRFIGRRRGFGKFSEVFRIFWKISTIFSEFSAIFWKIFPKIFAIFFDFCDFPTIFPKIFSENSRSQSVAVQPGSRHYCKFTSKFTPKFTPILIKILQSTKFEGSHFHDLLSIFITFYSFLSTFQILLPAFPSLRSFPFAAVFSQPWLRCAKGTNGRPSPCDVGGMWAIRGIISRITSLIVSRLTS